MLTRLKRERHSCFPSRLAQHYGFPGRRARRRMSPGRRTTRAFGTSSARFARPLTPSWTQAANLLARPSVSGPSRSRSPLGVTPARVRGGSATPHLARLEANGGERRQAIRTEFRGQVADRGPTRAPLAGSRRTPTWLGRDARPRSEPTIRPMPSRTPDRGSPMAELLRANSTDAPDDMQVRHRERLRSRSCASETRDHTGCSTTRRAARALTRKVTMG